jgi:hypothetical protein
MYQHNPLPSGFSVGGGGNYCAGGTGVTIYIGGSTVGVNYDLKLGGSVVATLAGTGSDLYFNNITAAGNYTVVATNQTTNCTAVMPGSATVRLLRLLRQPLHRLQRSVAVQAYQHYQPHLLIILQEHGLLRLIVQLPLLIHSHQMRVSVHNGNHDHFG